MTEIDIDIFTDQAALLPILGFSANNFYRNSAIFIAADNPSQ